MTFKVVSNSQGTAASFAFSLKVVFIRCVCVSVFMRLSVSVSAELCRQPNKVYETRTTMATMTLTPSRPSRCIHRCTTVYCTCRARLPSARRRQVLSTPDHPLSLFISHSSTVVGDTLMSPKHSVAYVERNLCAKKSARSVQPVRYNTGV